MATTLGRKIRNVPYHFLPCSRFWMFSWWGGGCWNKVSLCNSGWTLASATSVVTLTLILPLPSWHHFRNPTKSMYYLLGFYFKTPFQLLLRNFFENIIRLNNTSIIMIKFGSFICSKDSGFIPALKKKKNTQHLNKRDTRADTISKMYFQFRYGKTQGVSHNFDEERFCMHNQLWLWKLWRWGVSVVLTLKRCFVT